MTFIEPMLAGMFDEKVIIRPGSHIVEEKYDGHRLIVHVTHEKIGAWSRGFKPRDLPDYLLDALSNLPHGVYDGELIAVDNQRFYHVKTKSERLRLVLFDVLELMNESTVNLRWEHRRLLLLKALETADVKWWDPNVPVAASRVITVDSRHDVEREARTAWDAGLEGLIVKEVKGLYRPGRRGREWTKVKEEKSAVLTVVGFERGRGELFDRGPCAVTVLEDDNGVRTKVKTLNDAECRRLEKEWEAVAMIQPHPAVRESRKLRISYQTMTHTGGYQHPMWDRWENE